MNTDHAIVEEKGHIMVITLNRPEKRNALSPGMLVTLYEAWREMAAGHVPWHMLPTHAAAYAVKAPRVLRSGTACFLLSRSPTLFPSLFCFFIL